MKEERQIERETLSNGLTLITEVMPHVRSVALGIWTRTGSRREPAELCGLTHFIEHMLFKGTGQRSAEDIAREIDRVGAFLDAFTTKELVCLNTKVLDEHLPLAFGVIADMLLRSRFAEEDVHKEKSVILEEIKMVRDNPEDLVHEIFTRNFWSGHPLGRPILGTRDTVRQFKPGAVRDWHGAWFAPQNLLITAAGNLQHEAIRRLVTAEFGAQRASVSQSSATQQEEVPRAHARITSLDKKELEQVQICLGVPSCAAASERRFALSVLNYILGGGMSSRLFQNIREQLGLAYAIFSDLSPYRDAGILCVYAGTSARSIKEVIRNIVDEFRRLKEHSITEEELRRAKDHLKGSLLLSLESSGARMSNLARQELYFGRFFSTEQTSAAIEAVTRQEVGDLARDLFQAERIAATVLGKLEGFRLSRELLAC